MQFQPLFDRVVIKPLERETVTPSGIHIPDYVAKAKPTQGTVVAVGPGDLDGATRIPVSVVVGDVVLYPEYAGAEVEIEGATYLLMRDSELYGILKRASCG